MGVNCKKSCNQCSTVDGGFSDWSDWGVCSEGCGDGTQVRTRSCTKPSPAHGGKDCKGVKEESRPCKVKECPGSCRDQNQNCAHYRNRCRNRDANWRLWIRRNCPQTCGLCDTTTPAPPQPRLEPTSYCLDTRGWEKVCKSYKMYNWCTA